MNQNLKKRLVLFLKIAIAVGIWIGIYRAVAKQENAGELLERLGAIDWRWVPVAAAAQMAAIFCATLRWQQLLKGQGIIARFRYLFGSLMVGRFFGALTPGGLGFQGYRIFDIAQRTGKNARATATIAIELLAGQMGFAATVILGSFYGLEHIGFGNVLLIDLAFLGMLGAAMFLILKPIVFQKMATLFLGNVPTKLQTLVDGVSAYQGKGKIVTSAFGLSMLVHIFNNLIYVAAARALNVELTMGQVFFVSSLQIFATLVPISINGVGLREAAALYVYTTFYGVPMILALLIPILGFAVEMVISSCGGIVLLLRGENYKADIEVLDPGREDRIKESIVAQNVELPKPVEAGMIGLSAGALAGLLIGASEGAYVAFGSATSPDYGVLAYGGLVYSVIFALVGLGAGVALGLFGRLVHRARVAPGEAFARYTGALFFAGAFFLTAFTAWRDVFHKGFPLIKSVNGLLLLGGSALATGITAFVLYGIFRLLSRSEKGAAFARPMGGISIAGGLLLVLVAFGALMSFAGGSAAGEEVERPAPPASAKNVLFIVVDTLRADALPSYGYDEGSTPHLEEFAKDAIRYDQHFVNSSWTRPSFASMLTGRYAVNHQVMSQDAALPDELVTLAEAFRDSGYSTSGIVTNFNVSPRYNFHQGFDHYEYLEPSSPLGANESGMRLLALQVVKRITGRLFGERPGEAYVDAEDVNKEVIPHLDELKAKDRPFFFFVAYMDPHDPYFEHPYDGPGYSRAANPSPSPEEAPRLRKLYDGEITYWDEHFGALIRALKERGLYDETTIVITSDHGEEFMEHGGYWHGQTLYDEQLRVPLFVKRPYQAAGGTVVTHFTESVDIMPTLLAQNGIPAVEGIQGGLLDHGSEAVFAEENHEGNILQSIRQLDESGSVYKWLRANEGNPRGLATEELFEMKSDPGEQNNLAEREVERARQLDEAMKALEAKYAEGAARKQTAEISDADCQRLMALGYMESCD